MRQRPFAELPFHLPMPIGERAVADAILEAEQKPAPDHHTHENEMRPPCARKHPSQQTSQNKQDVNDANENVEKRQHKWFGFAIEDLRFTNATQSSIRNRHS